MLVVKNDSNVVFDDRQFVQLCVRNIAEAAAIFNNYGEIASEILGDISREQASGLGSLSIAKIVPFYLNLPNCTGASFFGINDSVATEFVSRFPILKEPFQRCLQIKAVLAQWNPSFNEAALFTSMLFISGYSGNDREIKNFQLQMSNGCNLILWKYAKGDVLWFERTCHYFSKMMKLLQEAKNGMFSAMEISGRTDYVMANVSSSITKTEAEAEKMVESARMQELH